LGQKSSRRLSDARQQTMLLDMWKLQREVALKARAAAHQPA
jgi:hypothetical protein